MRIGLICPKCWGELTLSQLQAIAETLRLQLTKEEVLLVLFCRFTDARLQREGDACVLFHGDDQAPISMEAISNFASRLSWVIETPPTDGTPNPTGVDSHLLHVSFGNYFLADSKLNEIARAGVPDPGKMVEALRLLGDMREEISIDQTMTDMVLMWWHGVGDTLRQLYPNVFDADGEPNPNYSPFRSLQNIHLLLNDDRPQENEAIDHCDAHDVLSALDHKLARIKAEEETLKRK